MKTSNVICMTTGEGDITYLGTDVRTGLGECVVNVLIDARVSDAKICIGIDGSIEIDELLLRTKDGRDIAIRLDAGLKPKVIAEVFDRCGNKWRLVSVADDYNKDLELTTSPWRPDHSNRKEDKI